VTAPLESALVCSLARPELCRALNAAINVMTGEIERSDPALATRLRSMLAELAEAASLAEPAAADPFRRF
jgi:hypothetical protein